MQLIVIIYMGYRGFVIFTKKNVCINIELFLCMNTYRQFNYISNIL